MFTTGTTIALTAKSCFQKLFIHFYNETDSNIPPSLEITFLLDSGAIISVLNIPTDMMNIQMFNLCNHKQHGTSKTPLVGNQYAVPI